MGTNSGNGGGIFGTDNGSVVLIDSTVSGNESPDDGGGIRVVHSLIASGSTISDNHVVNDDNDASDSGGGIRNFGDVLLSNTTVSSNSAVNGGGIYNSSDGTVSLINATVAFNTSTGDLNSGINNQGDVDQVLLRNTILAGNTTDCSGPVTSLGYNLDSDGSCQLTETGDIPSGDADLGPLQDNGGPTSTHALLENSDAIDTGNNATCAADPVDGVDQRGIARPQDGDDDGSAVCDIGAYEREEPTPTPTPTSTATPTVTPTTTEDTTSGDDSGDEGSQGTVIIVVPTATPTPTPTASPATGSIVPPATGDGGLR